MDVNNRIFGIYFTSPKDFIFYDSKQALCMKPSLFNRSLLLLPISGACLIYQPANAQLYIDGHIGFVTTLVDDGELDDRLSGQGLSGSATAKNTTRIGGRFDVGWRWHPNWSVETGYVFLGDAELDIEGTGPIDKDDLEAIRIGSGSGPELALKGQYALSDKLEAYGRAGFWMWSADYSAGSSVDTTFSGLDPLIGAGVQWQFKPRWTASFGWDGYKADQDMNHMFSVGAQYYFGKKPKPTKRTAEPTEEKITEIYASELNTIPEELTTAATNEAKNSTEPAVESTAAATTASKAITSTESAAESPAAAAIANTATTSTEPAAESAAAATTASSATTNTQAVTSGAQNTVAATTAAAVTSVNIASKIKTDIFIQRELQDLKMLLAFNAGDTKLKIGDEKFNRLAEWLKAHPEAKMRISGHNDNQEAVSKNETLSYERAATVARILISKGVPSEQLRLEGLGASKPLFDNGTEVGRRINRRVELTLE
ncbi:MAG: OmpA family protein [Oleibacter sp.]|nr:OmpA family protein [Thalassolituus sp.]